MTGREIVRALRCCAKGLGHDDACENCKVGEIQDRREYIEFAAANVIERLTAENAALREKVVQGQWEGEGDGYADGEIVIDVWYCYQCGYCIDDGTDNPDCLPKYCPNCGARMDGGYER